MKICFHLEAAKWISNVKDYFGVSGVKRVHTYLFLLSKSLLHREAFIDLAPQKRSETLYSTVDGHSSYVGIVIAVTYTGSHQYNIYVESYQKSISGGELFNVYRGEIPRRDNTSISSVRI